jgi:biopolymer transport protein TolR
MNRIERNEVCVFDILCILFIHVRKAVSGRAGTVTQGGNMSIATGSKSGPDINMTPLIDVLLVLLIIFMVITPVMPRGLPTLVPQPAKSTVESRTIVIRVQADGALWINNEAVTTETLGARLSEIFSTRAERVAFVQAESGLEFQDVARIIDIARGAGVDHIGLMNHAT